MKKQLLMLPALLFAVTIFSQNIEVHQTLETEPASTTAAMAVAAASDGTLRVEGAGTVKVFTGAALKVTDGITNLGNKDQFVVANDANLLQANNVANSGNIMAQRDIKVGTVRNQYNYLGSPVAFASGESYKTIYSGTTYVLYHNEANNFFYSSSGVNIPGRGLAVKEPTGSGAVTVTANYVGVPQNGDINFPVVNGLTSDNNRGYNLLGNPYPSNIDLIKLYNQNGGNTATGTASTNISATFYFWDNNVNSETQQQGSGYNGQAYAVFNALAGNNGTGTSAAGYLNNNVIGSKKPTNIVKVGQGFMVRSLIGSYSLAYNNSIRISDFDPVNFLGKGSAVQNDRFWLEMTAPSAVTSTIAVVYFAAGKNTVGPEDSESRGGSDELYAGLDGKKLAINGKSSFVNTDVVALGSRHFADGKYIISLGDREGIFANGQEIYLKDQQTGIVTDLSLANYTFSANAGEITGRFEIIYRPQTVLATNAETKNELQVYRDGIDFIIKSQSKKITELELYDASGRLVYKTQPNSTKAVISSAQLGNGLYMLKINQNGEITVKKILK